MKKLVKVSFMIFVMAIVISFSSTTYAAIQATVDLNTTKTEYNKDEEIIVNVDLSKLNADKGIIITGAKLEYDENNLEYIGMDAGEGWAEPAYNPSSRKLVVDRKTEYQTTEGNVLKMKFKVVSNKKEVSQIALKNIEVADGDEEVKVNDANMTVTLNKDGNSSTDGDISNGDSSTGTDNNNGNGNGNQSTNGSTDDSKANGLPNTGDNLYIIYIAVAALLIAIICLAVYLIKNKKSKSNV